MTDLAEDKPDPGEPPGQKSESPRTGEDAGANSADQTKGQPDASAPSGGKSKVVNCLTDVEALRDYMNRIKAHPRGMTTAVVKVQHGRYWRDLATIRLDKATGEIEVTGEESEAYAPTDLEAAAIKAACAEARWPEPMPVPVRANCPDGLPVHLPPELNNVDPENIFAFHDAEGRVVMLQHRATDDEVKEGKPKYAPWSHWDDGVWRRCEPDGMLPLWGTWQLKDAGTVFLHEGAKSARAMARMVNGTSREDQDKLDAHPWGRELSGAAHIGWVGGALAPHRTDWSVLAKAGVSLVYIASDNDAPGLAAVPQIARHLRVPTFHVNLTNEFPVSWDLADDFPPNMFGQDGRYVGPSFAAMLEPATWATDLHLPKDRGGKPVPYLRGHFKNQWVYADEPELFICTADTRIIRGADNLSKKLVKYSDSPGTARLLLKGCEHVTTLAYAPDKKPGTVTIRGQRAFNVFRPSGIGPRPGDVKPWLDFLAYLFPDKKERDQIERWSATLIARPDVRLHFGLLLASKTQGVGKGIFASQVLAPLAGDHNVGYPSEHDIAESAFNEWMAHKRLVVVGEIYQGQSFKAYNRLKGVITDKDFSVNKKHQAPYRIDNWCHVIACSNSDKALKMERTDRRWFYPQICEEPWQRDRFEDFVKWIAGGGLGVIAHWAAEFGDYIKTGELPPMTSRKQMMIEESEADELRWAREYCEGRIEDKESFAISTAIALAFAKKSLGKTIYSTKRDLGMAMADGGMAQVAKSDGQEFYLKYRNDKHRVFLSPAAQEELKALEEGGQGDWFRHKLGETWDALLDPM